MMSGCSRLSFDIKKMNKLLDMLDDDDDVKNVYNNWDE